ncbi:Hydroxymethylpyrimidine pyrophosphatase [Micromonospora phaseoli]|uniref:Hydroxymethylpyrimidine pyrophosphatase n=1 Tax=Micromonospora phaseoli TaxID=1144548 RepID=A0A1H7DS57_9ACTN|nr:HAD family hydrolase [Micromonospora phaseoli]PZV89971.1 hydroxymethylpyrimidine pyrophosphatase-like HAD family hydrolase [Micromonospora phaseoli]GIJ78815.1 haloacid dehalogenase [Micromonospora phaseoli]SEK04224.1 Hydroxymethylpyrimidine pyrophosphatase [Micromonospora phaseoli]
MTLLIALDVDGTIAGPDGTVTPRVHAAIRAIHDLGHHVVLATGRSPWATVALLGGLGLTRAYAVCSNGAVTVREEKDSHAGYAVVAERIFDPGPLLAVLAGNPSGCAAAVEPPGEHGFRVTAGFPASELPGPVSVASWERAGAYGARRVIVEGMARSRFVALAGVLGLATVADTTGRTGGLEVGPPGVSKASALEDLRIAMGVGADGTVAVGDHVNDLEMLRWAARGVAMGQAPAEVRAAANEVTGSCAEDGLACVLKSVMDGRTGNEHGDRVRRGLPGPGTQPDRGAQLGLHRGR